MRPVAIRAVLVAAMAGRAHAFPCPLISYRLVAGLPSGFAEQRGRMVALGTMKLQKTSPCLDVSKPLHHNADLPAGKCLLEKGIISERERQTRQTFLSFQRPFPYSFNVADRNPPIGVQLTTTSFKNGPTFILFNRRSATNLANGSEILSPSQVLALYPVFGLISQLS